MELVKLMVPPEIAADLAAWVQQADVAVDFVQIDEDGRGQGLEEVEGGVLWHGGRTIESILGRAPSLRWLHSWSAGVDAIPFDRLRERKITLTNAAGVYAIPIAEWVLAAMLMIVKQAHPMHDAQREGRWAEGPQLEELGGKTLLILGTGGIGREVARRADAFDMRIWGANRSGNQVDHIDRIVTGDGWKELLPESDFVVVTLPLTAQTSGMIGADELKRFKSTGWLINVGRGATIDEPVMIRALHEGTIGGAAIDAWVEEPLPPDHPAWSTPNLIIWPHHSGSSPENTRRGLDLLRENIRRFANGEDLLNVVDLEAEY